MTTWATSVSTEIIRTKFQSMTDEMNLLLARSAYSTTMRESRDCSYEFLDAQGQLVCKPGGLLHGYAFQRLVNSVHRVYGDDLRPGDIYMSNHPYECHVHHAPDLAVMTPVFHAGELVAFSCSAAHKPDFGGAMPGSSYSQATELIQEGFLLPVVRYSRRGRVSDEILRIIQTNVRSPRLVLGDMNSQIGITQAGAKRIVELMDRLGKGAVLEAFRTTLDGTEGLFREHVSKWPDDSFSGEVWMDDDGSGTGDPVKIAAKVTKRGSDLEFDFAGSSPQTRGPANMMLPVVKSGVTFALIALIDPSLPFNDGMWRAIKLKLPERSVVNPEYPAPVGNSTQSHHRLIDLMVEVVSKFQPHKVVAHSGGSGGTLAISWPAGVVGAHPYTHYEILGAATAGSSMGDGESGISANASRLSVTPIEIVETAAPLRLRRFELATDAAGAGKHRGGLSYRREYELLQPAKVNRRADRVKVPASGTAGGKSGKPGQFVLHPGTEREEQKRASGFYNLDAGDTFMLAGAGSGGYGEPFERDPEAVLADVLSGFVSVEAARDDYGVAIRGKAIDWEQTKALRAKR